MREKGRRRGRGGEERGRGSGGEREEERGREGGGERSREGGEVEWQEEQDFPLARDTCVGRR